MEPTSVSASSLAAWEECPAMYKASYIDRVPQVGKSPAADVGSVCHYALEHFVNRVYIKKTATWDDKQLLDDLVKDGFKRIFNSAQYNSPEFKDAQKLVDDWYARTDLTHGTVLSVEKKVKWPLPATTGEIPLTYIIDRLDVVFLPDGTVEIHVVDYKSQRVPIGFDDLENKLQAQIYALAVFLEYGKQYTIKSVWVHLDFLRHSVVGIEFTREQAIETWYWLLEQVDIIRGMDPERAPEVLGAGCAYCPVKAGCASLRKHQDTGGVIGTTDLELIAKHRIEADAQMKALKNLIGEYDLAASALMQNTETARANVGDYVVEFGVGRGMRVIDASRAATILGPEIMASVASLNIGEVDKLFEAGILTEQQKQEIQSIITMKYPQAGVKYRKAPKPRKAKGR